MCDYISLRCNCQHSLPTADATGVAKLDAALVAEIVAAVSEGKVALAKIRSSTVANERAAQAADKAESQDLP